MPDEKTLAFTANQQNAMAELAQIMASVSHDVNVKRMWPEERHIANLASIAERFPSINWGDMYDKFHRQGVNSLS